MMIITQTASPAVFEKALVNASQIGSETVSPGLDGLNSPVTDETKSWIDRIWDQVHGAIKIARRETKKAAASLIKRAMSLFEEAKTALGEGIDTVKAVLIDRLNDFVNDVVDGVLKGMQPILTVGNSILTVKGVTVSRMVSLSESFELSLKRVLKFSVNGELTIDVEYAAQS